MATRKEDAPIVHDPKQDHLKRVRDRVTSCIESAIAKRSAATVTAVIDNVALKNSYRDDTLKLLKQVMDEYNEAGWKAEYKELSASSLKVTLS
jgi:hypothetical protein